MKVVNKLLFGVVAGAAVVVLLILAGLFCMWLGVGLPPENFLVNAATRDDVAKLKKVMAKGGNINGQEKGMLGYTPLIATTFIPGTNTFFYLLSVGAKVDARDRDGQTALMTAIMACGDANLFKIQALIAASADVNAKDKWGNSVLQYAKNATAGRPSLSNTNTIALLLQHGAKE